MTCLAVASGSLAIMPTLVCNFFT